MKEIIKNYIKEHKNDMVRDLKLISSIPSTEDEALPNAPFGKATLDVLMEVKKLYEKNGFKTKLCAESGYLLAFYGSGNETLGIFSHGDVVPVQDDWIYTEPFVPLEKEGLLIGRGVHDNKSGIIVSLYTLKALKELNIKTNKRIIAFVGTNEESGMKDIYNFVNENETPTLSIVPDGGFPLGIGEKGILRFECESKSEFEDVIQFDGGEAKNIVLGKIHTVLKNGDEFETEGIPNHAATPEGSINAGVEAAKILLNKDISNNDKKILKAYKDMFSDYYGEFFGVNNSDPVFGHLTCVNGITKIINKKLFITFDLRYGISVDSEKLVEQMKRKISESGFIVTKEENRCGFLHDKNGETCEKLLSLYCEYTGDYNAIPFVMDGGTYARYLPNAYSIGTSTINSSGSVKMPEGHGGCHQSDEFISIDGFVEGCGILIYMVSELVK